MKVWRYILFPLAGLYGIVVWLRNVAFDRGFFPSRSFSIPLIGIGNLAAGGTGKSVVVDYLLDHFQSQYRIATLSRGYGRKTRGFRMAQVGDTALTLGDEPYQFFQKHSSTCIAVAENRVAGVQRLLAEKPNLQAIFLDDVFQHRWIRPQLQILTTTYANPFSKDFLLPMGYLREHRLGHQRAQIILLTKTPADTTPEQRQLALQSLKLSPNQKAYCCSIKYAKNVQTDGKSLPWNSFKKKAFLLVTGIANDAPLVAYLKQEEADFDRVSFPDHHNYTASSVAKVMHHAKGRPILTTEKDYGRLAPLLAAEIALYYLPINLTFFSKTETADFLKQVKKEWDSSL